MSWIMGGTFTFAHYRLLILLFALYANRVPGILGNTTDRPESDEGEKYHSTSLIQDEDPLLVLSTLDGSLIGVEQVTGQVRWTLHNDPVVRVPLDTKNSIEPVFLPDPKDGSLYLLASGALTGHTTTLKKLPFTIQQLVASSPCRSSDGMFYTGKKLDSWFSVNWKTGKKTEVFNFDKLEKTCPVTGLDNMFIGRTEYNILMYDSKRNNRQWNVTFFDYSTQSMSSEDITNYGFVHFGGSSSGRVSTYDRSSGRLLWVRDFGSPLVAVFVRANQDMASVPFTSVEDTTLDRLALNNDKDHLYPTLYVGEHTYGLYALPSLVGQQTPILPPQSPVLLIEGPNATHTLTSDRLLGHYPVPDFSSTRLQITGRSDVIIPPPLGVFNGSKVGGTGPSLPTEQSPEASHLQVVAGWLAALEHKPLYFFIILLIFSVAALFFYVRAQVQALQQSQQGSRGSSVARDLSGSNITATVEQLPDGSVRVGKVHFHTANVLGKGCEGTFVFKGEFESRAVAVKRLLPECFTVADREVALLRESDTHANVVRYFCTEQDSQFRYIALELCDATLQDYVERGVSRDVLSEREVLCQATSGLQHLHSLNIVHRDIKPHNVLLSMPDNSGRVRAMISDFGLCKKLQSGRTSFSRRSGVTGTDGWIAPEIILGHSRTMCSVDIFSLGCVFYYVLSHGKHPFGDTLHRQANILSSEYRLEGLSVLWRSLVDRMLSWEPLNRPPANTILHHPALWDSSRILTFLQDVSDRVEKEEVSGEVLERLETGAHSVCEAGDWRSVMHSEVTADLRKYRSYRGDSVRDLLRALRNKRHHFRELSSEAQQLLGASADSFTDYWVCRFPLLLPHAWAALQCVREEPLFRSYYHGSYTFPPTLEKGELPPWWYEKRQELLQGKKPSQSKSSPKNSRCVNDLTEELDSPRNPRKNGSSSQRNLSKCDSPDNNEQDELERENWRRSGEEKGVYRPRVRRRPKKRDDEPLVWSIPP